MMEPQEDPILDKAKQLRAAGATIEEVKQYLHSKGYDTGDEAPPPVRPPVSASIPGVRPDVTAALPRNRPNPTGDFESAYAGADDLAYKTLAAESNLIRGIKPLAMLQTGARALVRGQPYSEAKADLEAADQALPAPVRTTARIVGALPATMLAPASTLPQAAASGAMFGAADAMSDKPTLTPGEAVTRMAAGAGTGALVGGGTYGVMSAGQKLAQLGKLANDVRKAPTLGRTSVDEANEIKDVSRQNYGQVRQEVAEAPRTTQSVQAATQHETIAPYVDKVRSSPRFREADDATVLMEAFKQMSRRQAGIKKALETNKEIYDPALDIEMGDLRDAKLVVRDALSKAGVKPPVTLDVAPEVIETNPVYSFGHEYAAGPVLPGTAGRARGEASQVGLESGGAVSSVSPRDVQGPMGPAFQLRANPEKLVSPGVRIETPGMRIQTAPAEAEEAMAPSFNYAVDTRAAQGRIKDAGDRAADFANLLMNPRTIKASKQPFQSQEAIMDWAKSLTPEEAQAALVKVLGRGKESIRGALPNTLWAGGGGGIGFALGGIPGAATGTALGIAGRSGMRLNRLSPFIDALREQAGQHAPTPMSSEQFLRILGMINAGAQP